MPSTSISSSSSYSSRDRRKKEKGRERTRRSRRSPSQTKSKKGRRARADSPRRRGSRGRSPESRRSRSSPAPTEPGTSVSPPPRAASLMPPPGTMIEGAGGPPEVPLGTTERGPASLSAAIHLAHAELGELERQAGIATPTLGGSLSMPSTSALPIGGGGGEAAQAGAATSSLEQSTSLLGLKLPPPNRYGSYLFTLTQLKSMEGRILGPRTLHSCLVKQSGSDADRR